MRVTVLSFGLLAACLAHSAGPVSAALAADGLTCDTATIAGLRSKLPEMTNDDARDVAKARLDEAQADLAAKNVEGCLDALERARRDIGSR